MDTKEIDTSIRFILDIIAIVFLFIYIGGWIAVNKNIYDVIIYGLGATFLCFFPIAAAIITEIEILTTRNDC